MPDSDPRTITVELLTDPRKAGQHQLFQGDALTVVTTGYDMTGVTRAIAEIHPGGPASEDSEALATVEIFDEEDGLTEDSAIFEFTSDQMLLPLVRRKGDFWQIISLLYAGGRKKTFYAAALTVHATRANLTGLELPAPGLPATQAALDNVVADLAAEAIAREAADDAMGLEIDALQASAVRIIEVTLASGSRSLTLTGGNIPAVSERLTSVLITQDVGLFYQGQDAGNANILNFSGAPAADLTIRLTLTKV